MLVIEIILAVGTWALAAFTLWLALKTRDMARDTNATARATLEAQAKAATFQEVGVLLHFLDPSERSNFENDTEAGKAILERLKSLGLAKANAIAG